MLRARLVELLLDRLTSCLNMQGNKEVSSFTGKNIQPCSLLQLSPLISQLNQLDRLPANQLPLRQRQSELRQKLHNTHRVTPHEQESGNRGSRSLAENPSQAQHLSLSALKQQLRLKDKFSHKGGKERRTNVRRSDASLMASCDDNHLSLKHETASADINTTWETSPMENGKVPRSLVFTCSRYLRAPR